MLRLLKLLGAAALVLLLATLWQLQDGWAVARAGAALIEAAQAGPTASDPLLARGADVAAWRRFVLETGLARVRHAGWRRRSVVERAASLEGELVLDGGALQQLELRFRYEDGGWKLERWQLLPSYEPQSSDREAAVP